MSKAKSTKVSFGNRNVQYVNGDRYYGETFSFGDTEEEAFNIKGVDFIQVGSDDGNPVFLAAVNCRVDSGKNPAHANAVLCNLPVEEVIANG